MNKVVSIHFGRRKRPSSILGICLDSDKLRLSLAQRVGGQVQVIRSLSVPLTSALHPASPVDLGTELRAVLDSAGIRERHCVVAIPDRWVLTGRTEMPNLPEADATGLLQLEAERCFSSDPSSLRISDSRCALPNGGNHVTLGAVSTAHAAWLEQALAVARLKPVAITVGLTQIQPPSDPSNEGLALLIEGDHLTLQINAGGGVAALRTIEGSLTEDGSRQLPTPEVVAREIRVTLGQLPAGLLPSIKRVRIIGSADVAGPLAIQLADRILALGLVSEVLVSSDTDTGTSGSLSGKTLTAPTALALRFLSGLSSTFEFLPPKPTWISQLVAKYSAGRLQAAGALAAALVALLSGALLYQQIQLALLNSRWSRIAAKVAELETMQQQIRQYRPWFDDNISNLGVIRELSAVFPQDGSVTATSIDIRDSSQVTCSGVARDSATFLRMIETLNGVPGILALHRDQIRGTSPIQFTFRFQWKPSGAQ